MIACKSTFFSLYAIINSSEEDPVKRIRELTDGLGADIVVDSTGNPKAMAQVVSSTRTRGKIALKSKDNLFLIYSQNINLDS